MTRRPRERRLLVGLVALILLAAVVVLYLGLRPGHQQGARNRPDPAPPASSTSPRTPHGRLVPGTLVIPKIGVKALIEKVTVDSNNDMAAPRKPSHVGWYAPGVVPGQPGDAVIDGHLDWYGVPQAVFYDLNRLRAGDKVDVISRGGVRLRFKVTDSSMVEATAHPTGLFAPTGPPRLTLITCGGDWDPVTGHYAQRLLVNASYVGRT